MSSMLLSLSHFFSPHLDYVAMSIIATLLVLYGDVINRRIKRVMSPFSFFLRATVFVMLCAFGYGTVAVVVTPILSELMRALPTVYLGISIVSIFILIGVLAERRRYI